MEVDFRKKALIKTNLILSIENADSDARRDWQWDKLEKLLRFAQLKSDYWKNKLDSIRLSSLEAFSTIAIQDRLAVRSQVSKEGSLIPRGDSVHVKTHSTSGSSGNPLNFYVTNFNAKYNIKRNISQYFIERRDIDLDRVGVEIVQKKLGDPGFQIMQSPSWGGFSGFKTGKSTLFKMYQDTSEATYVHCLSKIGVNGYYSSNPRTSRFLSSAIRSEKIHIDRLNIAYYINRGDRVEDFLEKKLLEARVKIATTYSCEEIGPIGFSCPLNHNNYHVASSNVLVETADMIGMDAKRIIVTALRSYATPFLRYDIGDIGEVKDGCECGWKGQVIYNLSGRRTNVVRFKDGRIKRVSWTPDDVGSFQFKDVRMRQVNYGYVIFEYVRDTKLNELESKVIENKFMNEIDDEIIVRFEMVDAINWGPGYKRYFYRCEM